MVDLLTTEPPSIKQAKPYSSRNVNPEMWRENALDSSRLEQLPSPPAIDHGNIYETYVIKSPTSSTEG